MNTVLIIGSKGMLGQALIDAFAGYEVIAWDKEDVDITNFAMAKEKIASARLEVIINAAAYNAVDKIEESVEAYAFAKKINAGAVRDLAVFCKENNILFVHYSSDYVFAGDNPNGYKEDDKPENPVNKYGETKLLGEKYLLENGEKYYLIRLSKLFGKPATSEGAKKSFVDTMLWLATEGGKTHLDIVDEEKGCPTYAPDLARLTRNLVESRKPYGVYHGANGGACTWYEWAKEIFRLKNITVDITPASGDKFPRPAKRPMYSELLNTKLPQQRSWQKALAEYVG